MDVKQISQMIDHTQLKAFAEKKDFEKLCSEAKEYGFKMVAINPYPTKLCSELLKGTGVNVGAAIAFPLGQTTIEDKLNETLQAIKNGADEIDYVINIGKLKEKDYDYMELEMKGIVEICRKNNVISKVIFENCYLTKDEITKMSEIAFKVEPDFIKTSTGFGTGGALVEDVKLMKSVVKDKIKVKAAGGIRDLKTFMEMVEAGAERIGTSSGISIIKEFKGEKIESIKENY
ncbi:MAG: deoxyribose-phosphate aldolase [Cetobacterium sp.]|uniref:deoxyribose-phosphate aldolase n=1 Tax=Cetobacterium sp. TaxID=2071632 RepID=UPI003F409721